MSRLWLDGRLLCLAVASNAALSDRLVAAKRVESGRLRAVLHSPSRVAELLGGPITAEHYLAQWVPPNAEGSVFPASATAPSGWLSASISGLSRRCAVMGTGSDYRLRWSLVRRGAFNRVQSDRRWAPAFRSAHHKLARRCSP